MNVYIVTMLNDENEREFLATFKDKSKAEAWASEYLHEYTKEMMDGSTDEWRIVDDKSEYLSDSSWETMNTISVTEEELYD